MNTKNADSALWKRMLAPNDTLSAVLAQPYLRKVNLHR